MPSTRSAAFRRTCSRSPSRIPFALACLFLLAACGPGEEAVESPSAIEPAADTTESPASSDVPDSGDDSPAATGGDRTDGIDEALLDENQQLFESTVGPDYLLVFEVVSSVTAQAGPVRVEVRDRRPVSVDYPDAMTEQILPEIPLLTVPDMFSRARAVLDDGGVVEVEFDASYGHPLVMSLDPIPSAIDDELSITVRSVEPLDPIGDEGEGY